MKKTNRILSVALLISMLISMPGEVLAAMSAEEDSAPEEQVMDAELSGGEEYPDDAYVIGEETYEAASGAEAAETEDADLENIPELPTEEYANNYEYDENAARPYADGRGGARVCV